MAKLKVKKGDRVEVLAGRDKGKRGDVLRALPRERRVVVQGVNVAKKHQRPSPQNPQGGIEEKELAIDVSNVALVDPSTDRPTRVGYRFQDDGRKVRVSKRSGDILD